MLSLLWVVGQVILDLAFYVLVVFGGLWVWEQITGGGR